jgi:ribose transport system permease protein
MAAITRRLRAGQAAITLVAVAIFIFFAATAPHFTDLSNLDNILQLAAFTLIIGVPLTYLLIAGEFDLSVGANFALGSVVEALAITKWGWNPWLAMLFAVCVAALVGVLNALVTVRIGVLSFVTTLGTSNLVSGLALILTGGLAVVLPDSLAGTFFNSATGGSLLGIPAQAIWALAVFALLGFVLRYTVFGAHIYATGGNRSASLRLGVKTAWVRSACFIIVGAGCGLAGAVTAGWLHAGDPTAGQSGTLQLYAAVIIGGVAITGGEGTVYGTLIGALIVSMLQSGLVLMGAQGSWVQFFEGLLIVVAGATELIFRPDGALAQSIRQNVRRLRGPLMPGGQPRPDTQPR